MKLSTTAFLSLALAFVQGARAQGQAPTWGQCGGIGWNGATTCVSGNVCTVLNPYYSQCIPGTAPPPPPPPPSSQPATSTTQAGPTQTGPAGPCATAATVSYNNAALPDPFTFNDGTPVRTKEDWTCRRAQIAALIKGYEAGELPGKPSQLSGSFSQSGTKGTLTVNASNGGASINFASTITYPSGSPPAGGWPLLIAYEGGSIPVPAGIAVLNYANSNMGKQDSGSSRGQGLFFNLYGSSHTASAMTAWVWGVSRIIDVLETTPSANINTQKIAVTGCSRNGKGALMAGAFEERIALTIPQESGSGGDACWRLSLFEQQSGREVQTATEIVGENVWFSSKFNSYVNNLNTLPYDHHLLAALVAPRAMISYENTDFIWLSNLSSWGCMSAAHTVWQAFGVPDNHGFQQVGGHNHCAWPASLTPTLNAFFNKFLNGQSVATNYFSTNNVFGGVQWTPGNWIKYTTPKF